MPTCSAFPSTSPPSRWSRRRRSRARPIRVHAVSPDRDALEITFPRVEGYRVELPDEQLTAKFGPDSVLELTPDLVGPSITENQGIIGEGVDLTVEHLERHAPLDHPVSPRQVPALPEVPRSRRRAEAAPVRPAQGDRAPVAGGRLSALHRRHLPGAAHLSGNRRHGLRADQGGDHRNAGRANARSRRSSTPTTRPAPPASSTSPRRRKRAGRPIRASATSTGSSATATGRPSSAASPRATRASAPTSRTRTSASKCPI